MSSPQARSLRASVDVNARKTIIFTQALLCIGLCFNAAAHAAPTPFTGIVAFGDSEVDNGNRLVLQNKPRPPYWEGRHSNGKVSVEIYAETLNVPLTDYGFGGAFTDRGNIDVDPAADQTGLFDQFDMYAASHAAADPNALYFIYAGANDFNALGDTPDTALHIYNNYLTLINALAGMGAQHFMVVNRYWNDDLISLLNNDLYDFAALADLDIFFFDALAVIFEMEDFANPYGFSDDLSGCYTGTLTNNGPVCDNPDERVYWDNRGHLSAVAQRILGGRMANTLPGFGDTPNRVPLPATWLLVLVPLIGLVARRGK